MKAGWWKTLVVAVLFCLATTVLSAQTFTSLADFERSNGAGPLQMIQGLNGSFYGVTIAGGSDPYCPPNSDCGTIFEITPAGKVITLHNFCSELQCADGYYANGLMQASNGNLYGTTRYRGAHYGGTIFELTPAGKFTTLYSFCAQTNCTDGSRPVGALIQATNEKLYGLTASGGGTKCQNGCGTMFQITLSGQFASLFSFCAKADCAKEGRNPFAGLTAAPNGNFYGTTFAGGRQQAGTVFTITPAGLLTKLYDFYSQPNGADGWDVEAPLTLGNDGNLYGTTFAGGVNRGGTVFKITPTGQFTSIYSFCSSSTCLTGFNPIAPVALGSDGNFYGTTWAGGGADDGVAFQITPAGEYAELYSFCSEADCKDGYLPNGGIIQSTDGSFYGTTLWGGDVTCGNGVEAGCGTFYSIFMGLGPYVQPQPTFAPSGRQIQILGNDLTGTTSVTFNGTPATFKVRAATYITATVPADATTGPIEVTTPSGTLNSNVPFQVLP
jgi:uncharacterized repeat protein (TIGR03803 family)